MLNQAEAADAYEVDLANKLMVIAGSAIGVTLLVFTGLSGWMVAERTNDQVLQFASERAASVTAQTSVQIVDAVSAGNTLAATLSGFMSSGPMRKADAVAAVRAVLERYPSLFGTWMSDTTEQEEGECGGYGGLVITR